MGKVIQGLDTRLYMPDGSVISQILGGKCLKDAVDHVLARGGPQQTTSVMISTFLSNGLSTFSLVHFILS